MAKSKLLPESFILPPGHALRLLGWMLLGLVAAMSALMLLPNKPYYRWQQGDGTILFRARWVYERIHFDPRPIDVAFIGSSRIEASIRSDELSDGFSRALGRPVSVVNFGLPMEGRDLQWAEAKELLDSGRRVKLIVLLLQPESRKSHPAFRYIGDDASIIGAPMFVNFSYVENTLTVPYRHLAYFVEGLWPQAFQLSATFDPAIYAARSFDPTKTYRLPYGAVIDRDQTLPAPDASIPKASSEPDGYHSSLYGHIPLDQRFAADRHYIRLIANLALERGAAIAFLSIPTFHRGEELYADPAFFHKIGPVVQSAFIADDAANYMDWAHLNRTGTERLTPWLLAKLTPIVRKAEAGRSTATSPNR